MTWPKATEGGWGLGPGPQELHACVQCTLVPNLLPRVWTRMHMHAQAGTSSPCLHGCCAVGRGASSGRSSPAPSFQQAPTLWGLFIFCCLIR